jgi:hypothetical protein
MFDWIAFLDKHGIEYTERGPSTAKGNVYTHCPFCVASDQGRHMGISLNGKGWGCWRETTHRGKNPVRLIQALLQCSWSEAQGMFGGGRRFSSDFLSAVTSRLRDGLQNNTTPKYPLEMPQVFHPLKLSNNPHYYYLRDRGFNKNEIECAAKAFDLHTCLTQDREWNYRLIFPVYGPVKTLMTWTGRTIGHSSVRYKSLTTETDKTSNKHTALCPITDCFLREHELFYWNRSNEKSRPHYSDIRIIVLVEGPLDCVRLDLAAQRNAHLSHHEIQIAALFGKNVSPAQMDKLAVLREDYDHIVLLLDPDASMSSLRAASQMTALDVQTYNLEGHKDPGDMTAQESQILLARIADRFFG